MNVQIKKDILNGYTNKKVRMNGFTQDRMNEFINKKE